MAAVESKKGANEETKTNAADLKGKEELGKGRHYMVMMCQSWSGEGKSIRFMDAMWCLGKFLNGQWIRMV